VGGVFGAGFGRVVSGAGAGRRKSTLTVITTATGTPSSRVGA
jgi:hypothetical protein